MPHLVRCLVAVERTGDALIEHFAIVGLHFHPETFAYSLRHSVYQDDGFITGKTQSPLRYTVVLGRIRRGALVSDAQFGEE